MALETKTLETNDVYKPRSLSKSLNGFAPNNSQKNQDSRGSALMSGSSAQKSQFTPSLNEATKLSLSAFDSKRAGFLTESELVNSLKTSLNSTGIQAPNTNSNDFSPKAVADRILQQVSTIIEQFAGSPEEAKEMLEQARNGIAKGIDQASDTLKALGALNDKGLENLEKTLARLYDTVGIKEKQKQPQPKGEEQIFQTQIVQIATSLAQTQATAGSDKRTERS